MKIYLLNRAALTACAGGVLLLSGCASDPKPPTNTLNTAETAISRAEDAQAGQLAPLELRAAHDKLTASRDAIIAKNMDKAQRLAEQATVDAELATAKAQQAKAEQVNAEMQRGIDAVRQEAQRSSTGAQ